MKKLVVVLLALFLATQLSRAQAFTSFQGIIAEPTESFREVAGTGFGGQATYMYFFHPRFALTGSVGYIKWGSRVDSASKNPYKFVSIPVQFGLRFLLSKDVVSQNREFKESVIDFLSFEQMEEKIKSIPNNESVFVLCVVYVFILLCVLNFCI